VNDVDLEVIAPGGATVYKGNVITNGHSSPAAQPMRSTVQRW